ncbi:P-loop containing nucleoside triphosphate hydrolase protein [Jaminaea rosea]|uniref:RNA helicase n=1 Tax=Jaminaea rosea TaxID=1569628 RepID=A0A316UR00_9BASI|nr:P-loop containing nucleoside triphosphate hydrolase protein [Jaminaea rosea]PWN25555.1 P-loop containing nucleoside triphosphate hydrolase protein [Jaminaea rosea]
MSTAFRTLSMGVGSFDKSKSSFHDVFKPTAAGSSAQPSSSSKTEKAAQSTPIAASLPDELDFFAPKAKKEAASSAEASSSTASAVTAKKRKRTSASSSNATPLDSTTLKPFLRAHRINITCSSPDYPLPLVSWDEAITRSTDMPSWLIDELQAERGWDLTPIQRAALPVAMNGRDLLAMAPTGSGKTLAYLVPLLHRTLRGDGKKEGGHGPRAVILSPTRELATQIYDEARRLLRARPEEEFASAGKKGGKKNKVKMEQTEGGLRVSLLTGGDQIRPIAAAESEGEPKVAPSTSGGRGASFDLVIATPLRLLQATEQEGWSLSNVVDVVLDEADTLLGSSSAFLPQVDSLLSLCTRSSGVRKSLFTATLPSSVETLARSLLAPDHVRLIVGRKDASSGDVEQSLRFVGSEEGKLLELRSMAKSGGITPPTLLFVQTIERAKDLLSELAYDGLRVDAIHSDRSRSEREGVLRSFKQGKVWLLICTEVMARGLDFKGVDLVINYDLPTSTESYVHRVGRTGRAGRRGRAVSFFTKEDVGGLRSILNLIKQSVAGNEEELRGLVPAFLLDGGVEALAAKAKGGSGAAASKKARKKLKTRPVQRQAIAEASGSRRLEEDRKERREGRRLPEKVKEKERRAAARAQRENGKQRKKGKRSAADHEEEASDSDDE